MNDLPECEITGAPLSAESAPSDKENDSDLILVDRSDLTQANQKMFERLMGALKGGDRPVLLLSHNPMISELERVEHVRSGLNGMVTRETLRACLDTIMNLEPVDPDYDWDVALSLVQPFANAACEVLETTANAKTRVLGFITGRVVPPDAELASCMTLEGEIDGLAVAAFSRNQAKRLAAGIACCTEEDLTDSDLLDGVKEIINQISGRVRTLEWADSHKFDIDLPHVFHLDSKEGAPHSAPGWITVLIDCHGEICSVSLKASKAKREAVVL